MLINRIRAYGRQEGYFRYESPDEVKEATSFTCQHCGFVVPVPLLADPANIGGVCKLCMGLICPRCVSLGRCDPIERKLERMERAETALRHFME